MNGSEESRILVAIAELKRDSKHLEDYIYKEMKPDIEHLCNKVTNCMEKAEECSRRNIKWMVATLLSITAGSFGWIAFLLGKV